MEFNPQIKMQGTIGKTVWVIRLDFGVFSYKGR